MMKKIMNVFLVAIFLVGLVAPMALAEAPRITFLYDSDVLVYAGDEFNAKIVVEDEDGDIITSLTSPEGFPVPLIVEENVWEFVWNTQSEDVGNHDLTFQACDITRECSDEILSIEVLEEDMPVDYDEDGVSDLEDNCKYLYNDDQADIDRDAIGDVCDEDQTDFLDELRQYEESYAGIQEMLAESEVDYKTAMCSGDTEQAETIKLGIAFTTMSSTSYELALHNYALELHDQGNALSEDFESLSGNYHDLTEEMLVFLNAEFDPSVCEDPVFEDADGDRVVDSEDNCPNMANPDQLDTDGDGTGDVCELSDVEDADADGVVDSLDNCPVVANADQLDTDADTFGDVCDLDDDADTILDTLDNCPLVANLDQLDTDADNIGDVCDTGDDPVDPVTYKDQYKDLKDEYETFEDDYQYNKKKYNNAVEDDDEDDIEKYQDRLEELDDDLKDLDDDVESLIDDVESEDDKDENLLDNLDELEDDIENLREKIDNVLNGEDDNTGYVYESTYVPPKSTSSDEPAVVVEQLDFANLNPANSEPVNSAWDNVRYLVWLIAGIVVLIAVLLFFLALLLG